MYVFFQTISHKLIHQPLLFNSFTTEDHFYSKWVKVPFFWEKEEVLLWRRLNCLVKQLKPEIADNSELLNSYSCCQYKWLADHRSSYVRESVPQYNRSRTITVTDASFCTSVTVKRDLFLPKLSNFELLLNLIMLIYLYFFG